jgi:hypothetical protein
MIPSIERSNIIVNLRVSINLIIFAVKNKVIFKDIQVDQILETIVFSGIIVKLEALELNESIILLAQEVEICSVIEIQKNNFKVYEKLNSETKLFGYKCTLLAYE